ncbi:hypothetical protein SLS58_009000 [Diplodia intermedia]|uniref:Programmed cell death protein 2 C-terminal domain-containing protein n=1 Tax=Diplodia intermedia TaxID=856260 RepID=A0ABR3TEW5_9PEZI
MPPYDSDASDGDSESEYTETNVLLGYASKEPTDDTFSQLGGQPTWPTPTAPPPSFASTRCGTCNAPMPLLLQLNGDSPQHFPGHTRRLYVFGCRRKACARKGSATIRALRAVGIDAALAAAERKRNEDEAARAEARRREEEERRARQAGLGSAVFGGGGGGGNNPFAANPFAAANGGGGGGAANPFASPASGLAAKPAQTPTTTIKKDGDDEADSSLPATFAEKARIAAAAPGTSSSQAPAQQQQQQQPYEPWPTDAAQLAKAYPSYHLDADYETLSPADDEKSLPANAELDPHAADPDDAEVRGGRTAGKQEKQIYESLMDKTFQRFADRLAQNPEQVLRYEWRGEPLLYSRKDGVGRMLANDDDEENDDDDDDEDDDDDREKVKTVGSGGRGAKGMPRCANCGAERVFEVQLTPQAIAELEAEELGLEGMEWGTVIVGVCAEDCAAREAKEGEVGYVEEWVGVQWEEVADRK